MEAVESESESLRQESQIMLMSESSICQAENVKGFHNCVKEIFTLIEKDEDYTKVTAETYDFKMSQLKKLVTELSHMHWELADIHLNGEVSKNTEKITTPITLMTPMDFDVTFNSSGGGFHISKRECSDSGNKQLISRIKESKVDDPDVLLKKISVLLLSLQEKLQNLSEENSNLTRNLHEKESELQSEKANLEDEKVKVVELEKQVSDLKLDISESNRKIELCGKVFRKQASLAHDEVVRLSSKLVEQYGYLLKYESTLESLISLTRQHEEQQEAYRKLEEQVSIRNKEIKKLKAKNNGLKTQLIEKGRLVEDLNQKHDSVMSEKDGVKAQLDTLQAEMCSRDTKIQELETRLGSLQADHERVVLSFDDEKNDLKLKVMELEKEMSQPNTEKFTTPVGFDVTFSSSSELILPVNEDAKETKVNDPDVLRKKISVLEGDVLSLQEKLQKFSEENSNLRRKLDEKESYLKSGKTRLEEEMVELEKQVSESNWKLIKKSWLVDDLNDKHESVMSERDELKAQLNTVCGEMYSWDYKIQELETLLGSLQGDHERVVLSFNGEKNDLKPKVEECLEKEVDRQREMMSDRGEEKWEAIRQLSSSVEHYRSEYKQFREAFVKQRGVLCYIPLLSDALIKEIKVVPEMVANENYGNNLGCGSELGQIDLDLKLSPPWPSDGNYIQPNVNDNKACNNRLVVEEGSKKLVNRKKKNKNKNKNKR